MRNRVIWWLAVDGYGYKAIGRLWNISATRVRQIVSRESDYRYPPIVAIKIGYYTRPARWERGMWT